ncbi:hypothetical protein JCM10908_002137 [Rhodotorula pacifica]|uniref:DUF2237 domain-containing protein n=1 Tax=Rhodotorula pacifica TaxID=1495444 RepID=UPI003171A0C3
MSSSSSSPSLIDGLPIFDRKNVLGSNLRPAPVGDGPTTGFFRNNYCDASPHDPGSHTVAAVVTPTFLDFSKSRGNDLWPLFPSLRKQASMQQDPFTQAPTAAPCVWCLCASRWYEAVKAAASHPLGDKIVPRVVLEATHERALRDGKFTQEEIGKYAAEVVSGTIGSEGWRK